MSAAFRSVGTTTYASRTNTVIPAPAGIVDGDVLVLVFVQGKSGSAPTAPTAYPPGFTLLSGFPSAVAASGFDVSMWVATKTASSESGSYTVTHATSSSDGIVYAVSGGTAAGVQATIATGTGSAPVATGLTTSGAGSLVSFIGDNYQLYGGSTTTPGGTNPTFTGRWNSTGSLIYLATGVVATASATGNVTQSNNNGLAGDAYTAVLLEVPAATSPPKQLLTLGVG